MSLENNEKKYRTVSDSLKARFGKKVFKVSLDGHFTCPNKDGTKGTGGCIYCSPTGSGDFAGDGYDDLRTQFESVKTRMHDKWPDADYIAYFQANTNTYKDVSTLRTLFTEALTLDAKIVGLSIATRCDALDDEKIDLLAELNDKTWVQVELGLQSMHEKTAAFIRRGHDLACFEAAVKKLRAADIDVVVHIINGLPGEDREMMLKTIKYLNTLDIQGLKIHMLHVMADTVLGDMYRQSPFPLLTLEAYVTVVVDQLEHLHPDVVVHRVTGDSPKAMLIAPNWTLKKFVVMNEIDKLMRKRNAVQGCRYESNASRF